MSALRMYKRRRAGSGAGMATAGIGAAAGSSPSWKAGAASPRSAGTGSQGSPLHSRRNASSQRSASLRR
eukprot:2846370-Lingulodinium_polyedra.AAC.1